MADGVIKVSVSANKKNSVTVSSNKNNTEITATADAGRFWAQTAKNWAVSDVLVDNTDYSAKYYAQQSSISENNAKNHAETTQQIYNQFLDVVDTSTNNFLNTKEEALEDLENAKTETLATIQAKSNEGVENIENEANNAISEITEESQKQIANIKSTGFYVRNDKLYFIDSNGEEKEFSGGGGLEIGDIGFTQMAIDETKGKRRILNGQLIIQEQYTQFTEIVKNSVALNPDLACTESEWQTAVTMSTDGVCYKFVIDDEAGTIRLPKYPQYLMKDFSLASSTASVAIKGNGKVLGLTNGSQNFGLNGVSGEGYVTVSQAYYGQNVGYTNHTSVTAGFKAVGVTTDSSKSGLTGTATLPKLNGEGVIKGQYFIQVATGAETENNIINEIELNNPYSFGDSKYSPVALNNLSWLKSEGQWNSKAVYPSFYDWALTNANNDVDGFKFITEEYTDYDFVLNTADETFRLPLLDGSEDLFGNRYIDLTLLGTNATYSVPANGWVTLCKKATASGQYIYLASQKSDGTVHVATNVYATTTANVHAYIPVKRNEIFTASYTAAGEVARFKFTYATGNGSLYFYVGETVQNANLINAGRIEEKLASCITRNDCKAYITESYVNGTSWYRVWSDGFKEQGGRVSFGAYTNNTSVNVTLLKPFSNANYTATLQMRDGGSYWANVATNIGQSATTLTIQTYADTANINIAAHKLNWYACGY